MWSLVQYSLEKQGIDDYVNLNTKQIFEYKDKLLEIVSEILYASSKENNEMPMA